MSEALPTDVTFVLEAAKVDRFRVKLEATPTPEAFAADVAFFFGHYS